MATRTQPRACWSRGPAAIRHDAGANAHCGAQASAMAKLFATETAQSVVLDQAVQILGARP